MKQMLLRGLLLLLCGLLLLPALAGCRGGQSDPEHTEGGSGAGSDTAPAESLPPEEPDNPDEILIAENGVVNYRVIYPDDGGSLFYDFANSIAETIQNQVNASARVQKESVSQIAQDQPAIYVGSTEALRETGLDENLGYGDYRIAALDGDIYIAAYSYAALDEAVEHFNRRIRNGLDGGSIYLRNYAREETVSEELNGIPLISGELTAWGYTVGEEGSCEVVAANAAKTDFESYLASLAALSYTEAARRSTDTGEYATYVGQEQALYISLCGGELRVAREPVATAFLPPVGEQNFERRCDTVGYLMGVYGGGPFENGMSLFFLLADGTFLIYDGGHNESDADQLYRTLSEVAGENGLDGIRISAWIITHIHSDHVGMFPSFLRKYGGRVRLDTVFLNRTSAEQGSAAADMAAAEQTVVDAVQTYSTSTAIRRLQTGQEFWLADMRVEVLYTAADLRQGSLSDYNDACTVTRLTVNGKTVLITGDAAAGAWGTMVGRYGAALKSDILQVPHHGAAPGGTVEAYDLIDPDVLLWPAGDTLYAALLASMNPGPCQHLVNMVSAENIHIAGVLGRVTPFRFD